MLCIIYDTSAVKRVDFDPRLDWQERYNRKVSLTTSKMDANSRLIDAQVSHLKSETKIRADAAQHSLITGMKKDALAFSHEQYNRQSNIKVADHFVPNHPPLIGSTIPKSVRRSVYHTTIKPLGLAGLVNTAITTDHQFTPIIIPPEIIPVILIRPNSNVSTKGIKTVWATLIAIAFGNGRDGGDVHPRDVYAAYTTWMSTCVDGITQSMLDEALKEQDLRAEIFWVGNDEELVYSMQDRFPGVLDVLRAVYDDGRADSDDIFAIAAVVVQTIGRRPTERSYKKWWSTRLNSASQTVGGTAARLKWDEAPPLANLEHLNGFMSTAFCFRKLVFEAIVTKSKDGTLLGKVCKHILGLLAWAEYAYIPAIKYLVGNYVELFNLKQLAGEEEAVGRMLQFVDAHGDNAKYIKFYLRHEDCRPIHRELVGKSVIVAAIIAEFTDPSYANFYIDRNCKFYSMMKEIIKDYFELRKLRSHNGR